MFIFEKEVYLKLFQNQEVLNYKFLGNVIYGAFFLTSYANVGIVKNKRTKYKTNKRTIINYNHYVEQCV
ncbi:hypothetical protein SAMN05661044_05108 [Olivibacter domesticus]|uniref:Uncharacterized protein n=1 Tax=Olivibacter domesticus TaxID=407022 RepID=A0A1H7Y5Q4_OLID1|nr:hypothetical protein SAMN05661044_05108 [Olivibacter domesticus]